MISLTVSGLGAIVAAIGSGVLLARCFRAPRGDVIAWSVALLGLFVSLGAQALGHLAGFDGVMFRAMEIGGQVIAPLALILALSEVAARSAGVRFCARLYIPALALVATVILALDQLAPVTFTKAWPDPASVYQVPPDYVLMFAIGPLTTLIAVIAVLTVVKRSGQPGWNAVLPAQLMGGLAAVALAYPCLAQLVTYLYGTHVPVASEFSVVCTLAAVLAWLAGVRTGRLPLESLRAGQSARPSRDRGSYRDYDRQPYQDGDQYRRDDRRQDADQYRDGGQYRDGDRYRDGGYRDGGYRRASDGADNWSSTDEPDFATGDFATGDYAPGSLAHAPGDHLAGERGAARSGEPGHADGEFSDGEFATGDFAPGDLLASDLGHSARGWQSRDGAADDAYDDLYGRPREAEPADQRALPENEADRAQLFGQIEIYTLIEDRVHEFDELADRLVEQVRSREPDTLVFIVHAVPSAPMQRILYEVYRDRLAYDRHTQQSYVRQFDADRRPYVLATNVIELGLQQAKVSPFPSVADLFPEPGYDTSGFERPDYLRDYGRTPDQPGGSRRRR
jgi:quinol monooxygenase YgiN